VAAAGVGVGPGHPDEVEPVGRRPLPGCVRRLARGYEVMGLAFSDVAGEFRVRRQCLAFWGSDDT